MQAFDSLSPRIRQLIEQIEIERDRKTLTHLFIELSILLEQQEQSSHTDRKKYQGPYRPRTKRRSA